MAKTEDFEFGRLEERMAFVQTHERYLECLPTLQEAIKVAFIRNYPSKMTNADLIILSLSKLCWDGFGQVQLLCANRCGSGAFIVLRSMFENLVNARYLHMYPEKAERFLEFFFVHMRTIRNHIGKAYGEDKLSDDYKLLVETNFNQVRDKFSYTTGKGKEKTKASWSDKSLVDMAIEVGLRAYIVLAYYLPIERAHPSVPTVMSQSKGLGGGRRALFNIEPEQERKEASDALMIAHKVIIEMLILQHEYFRIARLRGLIGQCLDDYTKAWQGYAQKPNSK